ncbi:hemagglutinin repeat-containing protein, partial [Azonexus hydrophilus]|uniref:two-partner secretion domain-containing protein n=1 Tax=Azonexus hydrophilus TaxID=418702 RepID=UPI001965B766
MNRDVHRIVFNQARGQSMAVPESAAARGQTTNRQRIRRHGTGYFLATLKPLCFALLWSFGAATLAPVHAQVVAYKAAPGNLRPTIFNAGNGVPLINIQTPSAAGVSRNQYERLDAGPQGVIFNNSRTDVATQLGGWVQGNPWLAKGSARVILNEVLSGQPSQLNGYLEIAGQRAQLVIANPAGVTCDGCGFLNANRVTLTTGTPLLNGGNLEGYRVDGGQIRIEGNGLDASRVDYTDLIARAVQVNAGLWAQHLAVTAGANRVDAGHTQATPIAGSGPAPAFAIDVAQLGGMYAGKITLLGTEAGVGVRNAGTLAASAGEVVVTSEGKLINAGAIDAGNARITAATLTNQGQIYGDHLAIATQDLHNANTAVIAARNRLDLGVDTLNNHPDALLFSAGDLALGGALTAEGLAAGRATRVSNDGARIEALGEISLAAETIDNTNAHLETRTVIVDQRAFDEYQGVGSGNRYTYDAIQLVPHEDFTRLQAPDGLYNDWYRYSYTRTTSETQVVSSQPGRILAGGDVNLNADILNNLDSQIVAGGTLHGNFGTLNNQATPGKRTIQDDGTAYYYWRDKEDGDDDQGLSVSRYLPAPTLQHIDLGAFAYQDASAGGGAQPAAPGAVLPANRLYRLHAGGGYLLETDPVFANYRTWLSSDYLLQALSLDPAQMQKRLGDGFYEQRLIAEQVAQLTGRRFLAGYADDEAQYQALMAAGVSVAQEWQLIPGVALSAAQVAQLTTDIVWLVTETVTLPDGSTQQALVPRVYARLQDGDLAPSGALLAGNTLQLDTTGDLTNSGSIAGRQAVSITAENLRNLGTIQGEAVALAARQDIDIEGGAVVAGDALALLAGRDLRVTSTTQSQANAQGQRTNLDRVAGLYVTGEAGLLLASAGQDISLTGAELVSRGDALLQAGRDLNLDTVRESARQRLTYDARNARSDHQSQDIGSTLLTGGKLTLLAGHDVTARAAQVEAGQALTVAAGNDIRLTAGEAALGLDEAHQHTSKGSFSRTTRTTRDTLEQTTAIGSSLGGETVLIQAGRDLTLTGSNAVADADIALIAGRDLTLEAATETYTETHFKDKKKSGFSASLTTGLSYGKSSLKEGGESTTATAVGSQIGGNDVLLSAGRDATVVGSSVLADRDLDVIAGRDVNLLAAENRFTEDYRFK